MKRLNRRHVFAATIIGGVAIGVLAPSALGSPAVDFTQTPLVTANFDNTARLNSDGVKFQTKDPTDVRVVHIVFGAGGSSGWHHHPGMVLVAVASGSVTVWDSDCNTTTYGPGLPNGAVFTESGDEPGQVTSTGGATTYATFVAPRADPPVFRIEDDPPPCV
jgi:hypothetical protein